MADFLRHCDFLMQRFRHWNEHRADPAPGPDTSTPIAGNLSNADDFDSLFRYFLTGSRRYRSPSKSRVFYPGPQSSNGVQTDGLEGFARFAVPLASWLGWKRTNLSTEALLERRHLAEDLLDGILRGTNPSSPAYWGKTFDYDQKVVEAHDIALTLWLLRRNYPEVVHGQDVTQVLAWLRTVSRTRISENNWLLFRIIIKKVLQSFDALNESEVQIFEDFELVKSLHLGNGWFRDGAEGEIDYYNAWGFHYSLHWLGEIDPHFESKFISEVRKTFLESFAYFISPKGFPVFGRSLNYRTAISCPLIAGALNGEISESLASRAFTKTWNYFLERGCLANGTLSHGYFSENAKYAENYAGPASSLWGLRSLVLAFQFADSSEFWNPDPLVLLPVEIEKYDIEIGPCAWRLQGDPTQHSITLHRQGVIPKVDASLPRPIILIKKLLGKPNRSPNSWIKYGQPVYSNASGILYDSLVEAENPSNAL